MPPYTKWTIKTWLARLLSGKPHFIIGGQDNPYMLRWYLFPRNPLFNIYLHKFLRDDDDRALHDHPWWFLSFILKGKYAEITESGLSVRRPWSMAFRRAIHRHRVELYGKPERRDPCWTIVITGSKVREWGFWCPKGFVPWEQFTDSRDAGSIGKGCGD